MKIKYIIFLYCCLMVVQNSFGQLKINTNIATSSISSNTAFLDASSSLSWNNTSNIGKGLIFPKVDLIQLSSMVQSGATSSTNNPNRFDGLLVYNTVTGTSAIGAIQVKPGFYYYSNKSATNNGGTWIAVGSNDQVVLPSLKIAQSNYSVLDTDSSVLCNAKNGGFTVTLPAASAANSGKTIVIRKIDDTYNVITFSPFLKLDGVDVGSLNYSRTLRVQSDGTNWVVID
ncbi:hypothetical protein ACHRVZ_15565 [Flavobacterium sp. FlaQc-57]|uniref:hypothetical protein n=1 Tax=Flavobacterium sp. FlaQc-57 TaxID=3374186 RepID=UPI00375683E4